MGNRMMMVSSMLTRLVQEGGAMRIESNISMLVQILHRSSMFIIVDIMTNVLIVFMVDIMSNMVVVEFVDVMGDVLAKFMTMVDRV